MTDYIQVGSTFTAGEIELEPMDVLYAHIKDNRILGISKTDIPMDYDVWVVRIGIITNDKNLYLKLDRY